MAQNPILQTNWTTESLQIKSMLNNNEGDIALTLESRWLFHHILLHIHLDKQWLALPKKRREKKKERGV